MQEVKGARWGLKTIEFFPNEFGCGRVGRSGITFTRIMGSGKFGSNLKKIPKDLLM
jgi:hypothetical protein